MASGRRGGASYTYVFVRGLERVPDSVKGFYFRW